ncbi:MAG: helix-turn-helix domain-containing protein [Acidimicrobiales bacterium]
MTDTANTADTTDDNELTPQEWLDSTAEEGAHDDAWTHPDPEFPALLEQSRRCRRTEHEIVTSLAELRRAAGRNQTELAERWGHRQPHVSKVENDPTNVELSTLAGYVRALGGRLTITVEAGGHIYYEDLVGS